MDAKYLIDSNVFLRFHEGQQYDKNCFPEQYSNFLKLLEDEVAISIDKVADELDDDFFCKKYESSFKESISSDITETYNELRIKFPDYFNSYALENPEDADPYIITYAYHHNLCIVTQDEFLPSFSRNTIVRKFNIPTLVESLGSICIDNKERKNNVGKYSEGFGCICLTELIRLEKLME